LDKANLVTKALIAGMVLSNMSLVPFHRFVTCKGYTPVKGTTKYGEKCACIKVSKK
jgi:hypothetical protein